MIVSIVYIIVFLLTFFASSFAVARYRCDDPTDPDTLLLLVASALMWPVTIPLDAAILFLVGIAKLAEKIAGGAK